MSDREFRKLLERAQVAVQNLRETPDDSPLHGARLVAAQVWCKAVAEYPTDHTRRMSMHLLNPAVVNPEWQRSASQQESEQDGVTAKAADE